MSKTRAIVSIVTVTMLVVALLHFMGCTRKKEGGSAAVIISFVGYTNLPNNTLRFALLSIRNDNPFPIRWRGNWSEPEGQSPYKAPVFNPRLPWFTSSWALPTGASLLVAVGEPLEIVTKEKDRWRFSVQWTRYTPRQRLFDLGFKHPWLMKIPRFAQVQPP